MIRLLVLVVAWAALTVAAGVGLGWLVALRVIGPDAPKPGPILAVAAAAASVAAVVIAAGMTVWQE